MLYHHSADSLICQILAFISEQDVRARLLAQMDSGDWRKREGQSLQGLVQLCLDEALTSLSAEPVFGPVLLDLVRHRFAEVDFQSPASCVARVIAVEGVLEPGAALFYLAKEDDGAPSFDVPRPTPEDARFLIAHLAENGPCTARLSEMGKEWNGDVCRGASSLQLFFLGYLDMRRWIAPLPPFLVNLLRSSLSALDWHLVAAKILDVAPGAGCRCATIPAAELSGARFALLRERLIGVGHLLAQGGQDAPEPQRALVLFLANLCQQAGRGARDSEPATPEQE